MSSRIINAAFALPGDGWRGNASAAPACLILQNKARWGKDGGAGGKEANCQTKVDTKNTPSSFIFSTVVL